MDNLTEIKSTDLSGWLDDETYSIDASPTAEILNHLLERIKRLEKRAGRCECMNCVVIGV